MALRAFRGMRSLRRLELGGHIAMSQDGNFIAGFDRGHSFSLYRMTGELVARWQMSICTIVLGESGSWVAFQTHQGIEKWDVATQQRVAFVPGKFDHGLQYWAGFLVGKQYIWRVDDLAQSRLPESWMPHPGQGYAAGSRFLVSLHGAEIVLWDRVRERSVLAYTIQQDTLEGWDPSLGVTPCGRFALCARRSDDALIVFDLANNTVAAQDQLYMRRPDSFIMISPCGRYLIASAGLVLAAGINEIDWEIDPEGDPDPLTTAWGDAQRPPIVDQFLPRMTHSDHFLRSVARLHPELEVAYSQFMRPENAVRWLQRALLDEGIMARPDAWLALAEAASASGDLDVAADACAEGLGRDQDHPGLHALLARVTSSRKPS